MAPPVPSSANTPMYRRSNLEAGRPSKATFMPWVPPSIFFVCARDPVPIMQSSPIIDGFTVSTELDKLIHDCTAIDLGDRVASADVVSQRLSKINLEGGS